MDSLSVAGRSANMRKILSRDTRPELAVRRAVHGMGFRFRLHRKDLPGRPDLTLPRHRKVIFVHGCFWHQHSACREGRRPSTNDTYWSPKFARTVQRDANALADLGALGWSVLVIWECETEREGAVTELLQRFLGSGR